LGIQSAILCRNPDRCLEPKSENSLPEKGGGRDLSLVKGIRAIIIGLCFQSALLASSYRDQLYIIQGGDSLLSGAETIDGVEISADGKSIQLSDDKTSGYVILRPQQSVEPFNVGLPSWNGTADETSPSFKILMRFPYQNGWSPWLTVGYWQKSYGSTYGTTSYTPADSISGGWINIDTAELYAYQSQWQFKVEFRRTNTTDPSPTISKLSFFVSDTRRMDELDYTAILADKPQVIFVPTTFYYQFGLDSEIGGSICSPTSVSMILKSYGIPVEPVQFARDTYDPKWEMFGIWPRVVQNASEYGLDGVVTRYRNWSDAREVLTNGGRIAMSVGKPLYSGHLMMLAGFTENGDPIVHDPARTDGYQYVFNKDSLSHSWFDHGGVAYTFYLRDSSQVASILKEPKSPVPEEPTLIWNYPNPFNAGTTISFHLLKFENVSMKIYNINGECVRELVHGPMDKGTHQIFWDGRNIQGELMCSGAYWIQLISSTGLNVTAPILMIK